jgi:hypothetical protein
VAIQAGFTERDDVIQALPANGADHLCGTENLHD